MRIRPLREKDHAEIVAVVDEWWGGRRVADKLPRLFFRYFADTSFVVEDDGALVAFLVGIANGSTGEAYVHFVGVRPDRRGEGVGERLYGTFFDEARRRGCTEVRSITSPVNGGSIKFHARMGFGIEPGDREIDGLPVHPNYDGDGKDKVVFFRGLSPG